MEELGLDREPPPEGPCPDCDGGRIEVSLSAVEYAAALRQQEASERRAPVTVLRLTANHPALHEALSRPQSVLELPDSTIAELAREDARRLLPRALQLAHREIRGQYDRGAKRLTEVVRLIEDAPSRSTLPHDALHPSREPEL